MKYGVVVCKETLNIGDDIQSYAASLLLPRVDYYIEREHLDVFRPEEEEPVNAIINGWMLNNKLGWPVSTCINPLYISIHFVENDNLLVGTDFLDGIGGEDLKAHEPIGCRDTETQKILESKGIKTWFSGCLTLTLPCMAEKHPEKDYVCLTDVSDDVVEYVKKKYPELEIREIEHEPSSHMSDYNFDMGWPKRFERVKELLKIYQNAKAVITTRLHCAMPCLAMQTPVLLLQPENVFDSGRFEGLVSLTHHCSEEDFLFEKVNFDLENPPKNREDYLPIRNKLIETVSNFIKMNTECTSELKDRFLEYNRKWEKRALWKDRLCLTLEKKHLNRWLLQQDITEHMGKENKSLQLEICKLKKWNEELEEGKKWLSDQNEQLVNENSMLHEWTQEQDKAKTWLLEKIDNLEKERDILWGALSKRVHPDKTRFYHIISLGYNCEISFRIRDYYGKLDSTIYSWCYIKNRKDFLKSLDDPNCLVDDEKYLNSNGMYQCRNYDILFHTKVSKEELFSENEEIRLAAEKKAQIEMKERYTYLSQKFQSIVRSKEDTLYIIKMQPWENDVGKNMQFLRELQKKFTDFASSDCFRILVVLEKKIQNLPLLALENQKLYIRFVDYYAADNETENGGDIEGWNSILSEFIWLEK